MFGIHHYASFVAAILVFQLVPGPGTLAILRATARDGFRAGMGAVLGTLADSTKAKSKTILWNRAAKDLAGPQRRPTLVVVAQAGNGGGLRSSLHRTPAR